MMAEPLPVEIIQKIREEVLGGKSKYQVAKELDIGRTTIYRYTMDIPSNKHGKPLSKDMISKIREEVLKGKSKYQIAKEMRLAFSTVYDHTKGLPNKVYRVSGIQGKGINLLQELLDKGYVSSTEDNCEQLRKLKRFLPVIQRAQVKGRSVYFLEEKKKHALQAMIQHGPSRVFSYQELANISNVFDVKLSKKDKKSILSQKKRGKPVEK